MRESRAQKVEDEALKTTKEILAQVDTGNQIEYFHDSGSNGSMLQIVESGVLVVDLNTVDDRAHDAMEFALAWLALEAPEAHESTEPYATCFTEETDLAEWLGT